MPAKSERQRKFMALVATGKKKLKGLSPEKAHEFMKKPVGGYKK